jgi:hypothetical protein
LYCLGSGSYNGNHPELGTSILASNGKTSTDFVSALYAGGSSMSIVGASDFTPHSSTARLFYLFTSLTLTYLMQVYNALQRRNSLRLKIHLLSAETDDPAELLSRLVPKGQFTGGYSELARVASEMSQAKEGRHFYPVLFYFRFQEPYYSVSRFTFVAFDMVSLIKSALDDARYE